MNINDELSLRRTWQYPLKAIFSLRFYFYVLFHLRGPGFMYLLSISILLAIPGTYQVQKSLRYYAGLELPYLVSQIPPSRVDESYKLVAEPNEETYKVISTREGQATLVYNPENRPLDEEARGALIELGQQDLILHSATGETRVPYEAFMVPNTVFEPMNSAVALDRLFNAPVFTLTLMIFLWFYALLMINASLAAIFAKYLLLFIAGLKIGYANTVRLCSYGSTLPAMILLIQCFVFLPISFTVLLLIPLIYCIMFARLFRRELVTLGLEGFSAKYGFRLSGQIGPQQQKQQAIDKLTGRVSEYDEEQHKNSAETSSFSENKSLNDEQVQTNLSNSHENSATEAESMHNKDHNKKDEQRGSGSFTP